MRRDDRPPVAAAASPRHDFDSEPPLNNNTAVELGSTVDNSSDAGNFLADCKTDENCNSSGDMNNSKSGNASTETALEMARAMCTGTQNSKKPPSVRRNEVHSWPSVRGGDQSSQASSAESDGGDWQQQKLCSGGRTATRRAAASAGVSVHGQGQGVNQGQSRRRRHPARKSAGDTCIHNKPAAMCAEQHSSAAVSSATDDDDDDDDGDSDSSTGRKVTGECRDRVDALGSSTSVSVDSFEIANLTLTTSRYNVDGRHTDQVNENGQSPWEYDSAHESCSTLEQPNTGTMGQRVTAGDECCTSSTSDYALSSSADASMNRQRRDGGAKQTNDNKQYPSSHTHPVHSHTYSKPKQPPTSLPLGSSCVRTSVTCGALSDAARRSIHEELSKLDTGMPQLDFEKLERQLNASASATQENHRKALSEEVRRRLAAMDSEDDTDHWLVDSTASAGVPGTNGSTGKQTSQQWQKRPALGKRLQSAMELQLCYVNSTADSDNSTATGSASNQQPIDRAAEFNGASVAFCKGLPKSDSAPGYCDGWHHQQNGGAWHQVHVDDDEKSASELRKMHSSAVETPEAVEARLAREARVLLAQAAQTAHMQMQVERERARTESGGSEGHNMQLEKMVGVSLTRKHSRAALSRMCTTQLQVVANELGDRVQRLSELLVQLLIERDQLHMEQDSMLVDVEDLLQHRTCRDVAMPSFLVPASPTANNNNKRFRIFKRH